MLALLSGMCITITVSLLDIVDLIIPNIHFLASLLDIADLIVSITDYLVHYRYCESYTISTGVNKY